MAFKEEHQISLCKDAALDTDSILSRIVEIVYPVDFDIIYVSCGPNISVTVEAKVSFTDSAQDYRKTQKSETPHAMLSTPIETNPNNAAKVKFDMIPPT